MINYEKKLIPELMASNVLCIAVNFLRKLGLYEDFRKTLREHTHYIPEFEKALMCADEMNDLLKSGSIKKLIEDMKDLSFMKEMNTDLDDFISKLNETNYD